MNEDGDESGNDNEHDNDGGNYRHAPSEQINDEAGDRGFRDSEEKDGTNHTHSEDFVQSCHGPTFTLFTNQLMIDWSRMYMATHKPTDQKNKIGPNLKTKCDEDDLNEIIGKTYTTI